MYAVGFLTNITSYSGKFSAMNFEIWYIPLKLLKLQCVHVDRTIHITMLTSQYI